MICDKHHYAAIAGGHDLADNSHTRRQARPKYPPYLPWLLAISVILNMIMGINILLWRTCASPNATNSITGFSTRPLVPRLNGYMDSTLLSRNLTIADEAWSHINLGHGLVAVDRNWAKSHNLAPTRAWVKDREKIVYSFAAYHALHCLATIRMYVKDFVRNKLPADEEHISHAHHCIGIIRNELMCSADDTLLRAPISADHKSQLPIGLDEVRQCADWKFLQDWATKHSAGYLAPDDNHGKPGWGVHFPKEDGWLA